MAPCPPPPCTQPKHPNCSPSPPLSGPQVTPAHDPNDFTTGKRHGLEFINIFDDNGLINQHGGPFEGQPRFQVGGHVIM